MATSIFPNAHRADSTILPAITSDMTLDVGYVQVDKWQYFPYPVSPLSFAPLNRTQKTVPVWLKNCTSPAWTMDTGIATDLEDGLKRTSGEGYDGAYTTSDLDPEFCSIQARAMSAQLSTGISLQDGDDTIEHDYTISTVRHSITLGQDGQGSIRENGQLVSNNAFFKYEVGDSVMIELRETIVRYYLIRPDQTMKLLRQTRSKLTAPPKAEVLLYFTNSALRNVYVCDNDFEETTFESIGVAYYRDANKELYWQQWANSRASQSIGDLLEMADKRTQVTYSNEKKRLISMTLTPKAFSINDYWKFQDFVYWHDVAHEFIFIDYARKDLDGNPTEFWAKFTGAFVDQTRNGCQFDQQQSILEDFRNDFIPRLDDETDPLIEIDSGTEGVGVYELIGTASDDVLLVSIQIYLNGAAYGSPFLPPDPTADDWEFEIPLIDMSAGANSIYAVATDYAGNQTQSNTVVYAADATVPEIEITSYGYDGINYLIEGEASDNSGSLELQFYHNGTPIGSPVPHTSGAFDFSVANTTLTEGVNEFKVRATDPIGNFADAIVEPIINIDTVAPTLGGPTMLTLASPTSITVDFVPGSDEETVEDDDEFFLGV